MEIISRFWPGICPVANFPGFGYCPKSALPDIDTHRISIITMSRGTPWAE